jgi:type IV secretory pathway VirJ component
MKRAPISRAAWSAAWLCIAAPAFAGPKVEDLPIVETVSRKEAKPIIAILVSGDGGWAKFIRGLAEGLADSGVASAGLNSLRYLYAEKTPQAVSEDLAGIMRHYGAKWKRERYLLAGYSLGADILPAMINGLPAELKERIVSVTLLGPAESFDLEFHFTEWLGNLHKGKTPLKPEVERLGSIRILCVYGKEENDSLCPELTSATTRVVALEGGHHYGNDLKRIVKLILQNAEAAGAPPPLH